MNARISKKFVFQAAIHHEKTFLINDYELDLHMVVTTSDIYEQNIAMDRIKYLFDFGLESCIFVNLNDPKSIEMYSKANIRVCPVPDDPFDQIIGLMIMSKCNIITEGHLDITSVEIRSKICDDVVFFISAEEDSEFKHLANVWWNENNPNVSLVKTSKKEKIVELKKDPKDWNSIGLGWKKEESCDKGEVVYIPIDK
jgi:hypothetical protein